MRSGTYRQNLKGKLAFKSFVPTDLKDVQLEYNNWIVSLVGEAHAKLAELDTKFKLAPDEVQKKYKAEILEREAKDSVLLAQDTPSFSPGDVLVPLFQQQLDDKGRADLAWMRRAIPHAAATVRKLPVSERLILELHDYIMHADHNYEKNPGEFRRSPNWLGERGVPLSRANFIPPVPDDMTPAFQSLEQYMNDKESGVDILIRSALIHYQFEVIHPFLDGNGRVGRLISLTHLIDNGVISDMILPLSSVLYTNDNKYYRDLAVVEETGQYERFVMFWLKSLVKAAGMGLEILTGILSATHENTVSSSDTESK